MTDRPEMFAPTRGFLGMADSMETCTMPWQRNLGKFGLFFDKIAHESSCMPGRPDMFGPTRGDDHRGRSTTTFAVGAESNHLQACNIHFGCHEM